MRESQVSLLRTVARRTLPAPVRHWLVRTYFGLESTFKGRLEKRFQARSIPLQKFRRIHDTKVFANGPIVMVNNALASGGVERQIVNTLSALARRPDCTCGLLCIRLGHGEDMDFFRPALATFPGFVRNAMPMSDASRLLAEAKPKSSLRKIRQLIQWLPPDIQEEIHRFAAEFAALKPSAVHAWQDSLGLSAVYAAWIIGVPRIVISTRNVRPTNFAWYRPYMALAYQDIVKCSDIIIANNSRAGRSDYAQWLNVPAERFVVIYNGLDLSPLRRADAVALAALRRRLQIPPGAPVMGSMFRFYDEKRPFLWVEIANEVARRRPDVHFVIFGDGPLRQAAESLARRLGLGERFHAPGKIQDAGAGLSLFDVFVLASQFEGTPNVVLEASGLGIPVVATEAGGTAETIEQGVTGYLVTSTAPADIADRVTEILATPSWSSKAKAEGPAFVERRFGMTRMIAETLALYDKKKV
jgi:glycosyltransferase involved in cell wall biosynthesis